MEQLGINFQALLFQIINFGILFFVLKKFAFPAFTKTLEERRTKIQEGIENSEKIKKQLEEAEEMKKVELSKARSEAIGIVKKAREEAEKSKKATEVQAQDKAHAIIAQAEEESEKRKEGLLKKFSDEAVDLALLAAKNIIKADIGNVDQNKIMSESLNEFKRAYQSDHS